VCVCACVSGSPEAPSTLNPLLFLDRRRVVLVVRRLRGLGSGLTLNPRLGLRLEFTLISGYPLTIFYFQIGDEWFSWFVDCEAPKACSIVLRGANKDVLNEVERNLADVSP